MGHFVVAHHTFLCALLLRATEILLGMEILTGQLAGCMGHAR